MTQSKKDNLSIEDTIILDLSKQIADEIDKQIIINLDNTYGATTSYYSDIGNISITGSNDSSYTISTSGVGLGDITWTFEDTRIDPDEVERMSKEYPALEKVWSKFKSLYDMCKQDFEGKRKAGEIDE